MMVSASRARASGILVGFLVPLLVTACSNPRPAPVEYRQKPQTAAPADGTHLVAPGETVYRVARHYQVPIPELVALNGLSPPYRLKPGQRLAIPMLHYHVVAAGETVYGISRRYRSDVRTLVLVNDIAPPYTIRVGQRLRLPAKRQTEIAAAAQRAIDRKPATAPRPESKPSTAGARPVIRPAAKPKRRVARLPKPPPRTASRFAWPIKGRVVSRFGPKRNGLHNDGINISAARGTPVRAAESGVVVYVGNELRGFGNLLLLRHAGGWMTAYAHVDKVAVRAGQTVRRGQVVARVGSSGGVDRPQLHFEIRKGRSAVNPTRYLGHAV